LPDILTADSNSNKPLAISLISDLDTLFSSVLNTSNWDIVDWTFDNSVVIAKEKVLNANIKTSVNSNIFFFI
jgi:3-methyladenine DNA glycosylase AlkD